MAETYSQIYIQIIFSVKGYENLIPEKFKAELQNYMGKIIEDKNVSLISVYCMPDNVHIFVSIQPVITISELVKEVKASSARFINEKQWIRGKFTWRPGFCVFSYSHSHIHNVVKYINNQPEHHKTKEFRNEYIEFLQKFEVNYEERYLFDWI